MKEIKELDFSALTHEQKLGMVLCANVNLSFGADEVDRVLEMIREHRLGAVWVSKGTRGRDEMLRRINETADYPLLIIGDAECGFEEYRISQARALGACGSDPELGYTYGKLAGMELRNHGFNAMNGPVVDLSNTSVRHMGYDAEKVAALGVAIARGLHDAGLLSLPKHYPGPGACRVDSHMQEGTNDHSYEELMSCDLLPYLEMQKAGVLDGLMTAHRRITAVDPERPASLSKKVIGLIRDAGCDGVVITDALSMMGIVLKYGEVDASALSIAAGNDLALPWAVSCTKGYEYLSQGFDKGLLTEEELDPAVRHVLLAQHRVTLLASNRAEVAEEDKRNLRRIHEDSIAGVYGEGVTHAIPKDGHHLFVLLTERDLHEDEQEPIGAAPFPNEWFFPHRIQQIVKNTFQNSDVIFLPEYPSANTNMKLFDKQTKYDDVIYITTYRVQAYVGPDCLTQRVLAVMRALQSTNRIAAVMHFGNPHVVEDIPHVDRLLLGYGSEECVAHALRILCGEAEAKGVIPYSNVNLH